MEVYCLGSDIVSRSDGRGLFAAHFRCRARIENEQLNQSHLFFSKRWIDCLHCQPSDFLCICYEAHFISIFMAGVRTVAQPWWCGNCSLSPEDNGAQSNVRISHENE